MVRIEVAANARKDTTQASARGFNFRILAGQAIHIGGGSAEVRDVAGKTGHGVSNRLDFTNDGIFRAVLNDPSFVLSNRAEGAATKTAPHDVDRKTDHLPRWVLRVTVSGVRFACVGQVEQPVHFGGV